MLFCVPRRPYCKLGVSGGSRSPVSGKEGGGKDVYCIVLVDLLYRNEMCVGLLRWRPVLSSIGYISRYEVLEV